MAKAQRHKAGGNMQRVGINNVQSHALFLSPDFIVWCFPLSSFALCLCPFVPLCLPEQLPFMNLKSAIGNQKSAIINSVRAPGCRSTGVEPVFPAGRGLKPEHVFGFGNHRHGFSRSILDAEPSLPWREEAAVQSLFAHNLDVADSAVFP